MEKINNRYWWCFIGMLTIVHLIGMIYIDIMEVDAAQYASISQEMIQSGEYLQVHHRQEDYLDKPPLLFWVNSLSFNILGTNNLAFRLPSFLFLLLGLFATYKLSKLLYDQRTGMLAVLVLYSSQAYFLFSHDVRTDTILANVVIIAVWQLWLFILNRKLTNMIIGALAVGLAMLEKGPIGLMVPVLALGSQILLTRKLNTLWRWEWLFGLGLMAMVLGPMVYGLYQQFGMDGLEFYFWTQSFGRITGQSEWQDNSTIFYFLHTFLWAFLPWMFIAYFGVGRNITRLIKDKFNNSGKTELITLGGFVLTFIAMSLSRYKLPHYIFVVFPLIAIITANTIWYIIDTRKYLKIFLPLQWLLWLTLWIIAGMLSLVTFPEISWLIVLIALVIFVSSSYYLFISKQLISKLVYAPLLVMIGVNFLLNSHFYPSLLEYQAGSMAGRYVSTHDNTPDVYSYQIISHGLDYYSGKVAPLVKTEFISANPGIWLFTTATGKSSLDTNGISYTLVKDFKSFAVTGLTMNFLNPAKRSSVLENRYLLKISLVD